MKSPNVLIALLFLASCQSQFTASENILAGEKNVKIAQGAVNLSANQVNDGWYSDINEKDGFENYEEENGILLGKKYSIGTYIQLNNRKVKMVVLEEIQHQANGEAYFRQLDMVKIKLKNNQFLTTDFCSNKDSNDAAILAVYEGNNDALDSKKIIKAWLVNQNDMQLEPISASGVLCFQGF